MFSGVVVYSEWGLSLNQRKCDLEQGRGLKEEHRLTLRLIKTA